MYVCNQLLLHKIQTSINGLDDQIFEFTNTTDIQLFQQITIRNTFVTNRHCDNSEMFEFIFHGVSQFDERAFVVQVLFVCAVRKQIQCVQIVGMWCIFQLEKKIFA